MKYKVWNCKIVVHDDGELIGDDIPRWGAITALENDGVNILTCFSGWGGKLTRKEQNSFESQLVTAEAKGILDDLDNFHQTVDKVTYIAKLIKDRKL